MLRVFHESESRFRKKTDLVSRFKKNRESRSLQGGKAIRKETGRVLRIIGVEKKSESEEAILSSKALEILKELLER